MLQAATERTEVEATQRRAELEAAEAAFQQAQAEAARCLESSSSSQGEMSTPNET